MVSSYIFFKRRVTKKIFFFAQEYMVRRTLKNSHASGKSFPILIGSRAQVGHGTAYKTTGGLTRKDVKQNKWGKWVSAKKSTQARKDRRLQKHGFFAKKGKFGFVRRDV